MSKILFLPAFFLLLLSPQKILANNFKTYLAFTNNAEMYIINDNYREAEKCYDSAFKIWNKPFAIDLYNDLKCANLDSDYVTVKSMAVRLINLGCELSLFEDPYYLSKFRCSRQWRSLINGYAPLRERFIKNNNWKLRIKIQQMQCIDQFLRRQNPNYTFLKDSIYKADDTIKADLLEIFKHKFPNEYDYGVFLADDTTLMNYEPLEIIILHNYGKYDTAKVHNANMHTFDYTKIIMHAVENGFMAPEEFAYLNDKAGNYTIGKGYGQMTLLFKIDGKLYCNIQGDTINKEIEDNRIKIGLCTREEERAKIIYDLKSNENKFILRKSVFGIIDFGIPFTEKQLKKSFIYVDTIEK